MLLSTSGMTLKQIKDVYARIDIKLGSILVKRLTALCLEKYFSYLIVKYARGLWYAIEQFF